MAINLLKGYAYLIRLAQEGCYSLNDIKEKWKYTSFNDEHKPLTTRTFHNYRTAILETFNIDIRYNIKRGVYEIEDEDNGVSFEEKQYKGLLLNAFTISSLCAVNPNLSKRVLLDANPFGCRFLPVLISSIENNHTLRMSIQTNHNSLVVSDEFEYEPYAVKNYDSYWILWGKNITSGELQTINVYDIETLTETTKIFKYKEVHNDGWMNGWLNGKEGVADQLLNVKIKVFGKGAISSIQHFPLSFNQKQISSGVTDNKVWSKYGTTIDYAIFEYVIPEDSIIFFFNKIFKQMDYIQIISPDYLSHGFFEYINKVENMLKNIELAYGNTSNCKQLK